NFSLASFLTQSLLYALPICILQLKGQRTMETTARILFNTILGVGGLWDPATKMGLKKNNEDFGQTLGYYGVPNGPYLMLPFLGRSEEHTSELQSRFDLVGRL